jgi:DeoR/GlpR family transcriptional regulator of sugar metabolism
MKSGRQQKIETLLNERGECSVETLAAECAVSGMTIRRELQSLEETGRVIRTHGGATPAARISFDFQFLRRAQNHEEAKAHIAKVGAGLIPEGVSVMMDSGSTTLALASRLVERKRLTLITTSLPIASALQFAAGVQVLLLGGYIRRDAPDLCGAVTEMNLERLHADLAFIGADGIDLQGNIYNHSPEVARMLECMTAAAKVTYVVADSSKIGNKAMVRFGNISKWAGLITDQQLSKTAATSIRRAGVNLIQKPISFKQT